MNKRVAPYMGAWIETLVIAFTVFFYFVAPYMGAWIETARIAGKESGR